ncbi:hypothetical protein D9619_009843 [Psilocybe cf. subviscida]|uniref:Uncharacterized protein n=1 Tax=Psilocybe cf. subviscida TaxID=2480587 RepID=A0A8H5BKY2_9AGAR|nr:hypothetical protein D9619_009843 [Psilocybe cf. subviscida]
MSLHERVWTWTWTWKGIERVPRSFVGYEDADAVLVDAGLLNAMTQLAVYGLLCVRRVPNTERRATYIRYALSGTRFCSIIGTKSLTAPARDAP